MNPLQLCKSNPSRKQYKMNLMLVKTFRLGFIVKAALLHIVVWQKKEINGEYVTMRARHVKFAAILIFNDILILTNLLKFRNFCYFAWRFAEIKPPLPGLDVNKVISTHTICNHFPYNIAENIGNNTEHAQIINLIP